MDKPCEICGRPSHHYHHVFGAANRKHSETYNLKMRLCYQCHERIHNDKSLDIHFKQIWQTVFETEYSHELFMKIFGRNWLC